MKAKENPKSKFERRKKALLNSVCSKNKKLFERFFEFEEYKLKRMRGLTALDEGNYKTLNKFFSLLGNVIKWINDKPIEELTKEDIKKLYDGLEEKKLLGLNGNPIDPTDYYNKIFKSKLFELANKTEITRDVMEYYTSGKRQEVRFIKEEEFRKFISVAIQPKQKLLLWLAFDVGENINALLQLKKADCTRQKDDDTGNPEYRVNLRNETLKRSRTARSELTNFKETVDMFDIVLTRGKKVKVGDKYEYQPFKDDDLIFDFQYRMAKKFLDRCVELTGVKCEPKKQFVTWKDLRSSMACDLLRKGWTRDEVNARLGHRPSSAECDKYINFLALDRKKPQKKVYEHNLSKMKRELEETKEKEKLQAMRFKAQQDKFDELANRLMRLEGQAKDFGIKGVHKKN